MGESVTNEVDDQSIGKACYHLCYQPTCFNALARPAFVALHIVQGLDDPAIIGILPAKKVIKSVCLVPRHIQAQVMGDVAVVGRHQLATPTGIDLHGT